MKIYTKTGDAGFTSLIGGDKVLKSNQRVITYGAIDELNAFIGLLSDYVSDAQLTRDFIKIQQEMFVIGAYVATPSEKLILKNGQNRLKIDFINESHLLYLEEKIDLMQEQLPPLTHFVLPRGHQSVSFCHVVRTIVRRVETNLVLLHENEPIDLILLQYFNRLSDFFFVVARKLTKDLEVKEVKWIP